MKKRGLAVLSAVAGLVVAAILPGTAFANDFLTVNGGWVYDSVPLVGAGFTQDSSGGTYNVTISGVLYTGAYLRFTDTALYDVPTTPPHTPHPDVFKAYSSGVLIATTTDFNGTAFHDIDVAHGVTPIDEADNNWTSALWPSAEVFLAPGTYAITFRGDAPQGYAAGFYFRLDGEPVPVVDPPTGPTVPLPGADLMGLALLGGLGGYAGLRRRQSRNFPA